MPSQTRILSVGAISPLGRSWEECWQTLLEGAREEQLLAQTHPLAERIPARVRAVSGLDRELVCTDEVTGAAARLAAAACRNALEGMESACHDEPIGLFGGSTHGESDLIVELLQDEATQRTTSCAGLWKALLTDSLPRAISIEVPYPIVPRHWVYSACTSALHALVLAVLDREEHHSSASPALVVGVDALSVLGISGFQQSGAASRTSCRPFQMGCDGTVVSEGAAAVLIGTHQSFVPSGHSVRLLGFGQACDAYHPTRPHPEGLGLERAMRASLEQAGVRADEVCALILHGSGTPANDEAEASVVRRIFGRCSPPCTSLKGSLGHTMGPAGLFNVLAAWSTIQTGLLPPAGSAGATPFEALDLVLGEPRVLRSRDVILVNASGFGGNHVSVVLGR